MAKLIWLLSQLLGLGQQKRHVVFIFFLLFGVLLPLFVFFTFPDRQHVLELDLALFDARVLHEFELILFVEELLHQDYSFLRFLGSLLCVFILLVLWLLLLSLVLWRVRQLESLAYYLFELYQVGLIQLLLVLFLFVLEQQLVLNIFGGHPDLVTVIILVLLYDISKFYQNIDVLVEERLDVNDRLDECFSDVMEFIGA